MSSDRQRTSDEWKATLAERHRYDQGRTPRVDDPFPVSHPTLTPTHAGSHLTDEEAAMKEHPVSEDLLRTLGNEVIEADVGRLLAPLLLGLSRIVGKAVRDEVTRRVIRALERDIRLRL